MITFDLKSLRGVHNSLLEAKRILQSFELLAGAAGAFTTVPSVNAAFAQHQTIWSGQSGSAVDTIENIRERIQWVHKLFAAHISGFALQEDLSKASLDNVHSQVTRNTSEHSLNLPANAERQIQNLIYTGPIAAGEASTPLAALIQAFHGDDSIPIRAAKRWTDAGRQLGEAMANLNHASNMIATSAQGTSFDAARSAIGDLVKLGSVVSANTMSMAASVSQFPTIRATNLAALHTIQATTALIPEPAERLAAEQAAVASYVSSHLQPSLELVKPPVSNLGVPITSRAGGGALNAGAFGDASAPTIINAINGHSQAPTPVATGTAGDQAAHAASQAGHGNPSQVATAPASAVASPTPTPPNAPHLTPLNGTTGAAPTVPPSTPSPLSVVPQRPASASPLVPQGSPQTAPVRPAGGVPQGPVGMPAANPSAGLRTGAPTSANVSSITAPRDTSPLQPSVPAMGQAPIVGNVGNANAGARGSMGRASGIQRLPRLPFAAQSAAENNVVRGTFGSGQAATSTQMGAGGRGAMGVGATGTARGATARASAAKGAAVKAGANVFTFNKADRDYFTRQFMGRKKKTVRKVIAGR